MQISLDIIVNFSKRENLTFMIFCTINVYFIVFPYKYSVKIIGKIFYFIGNSPSYKMPLVILKKKTHILFFTEKYDMKNLVLYASLAKSCE